MTPGFVKDRKMSTIPDRTLGLNRWREWQDEGIELPNVENAERLFARQCECVEKQGLIFFVNFLMFVLICLGRNKFFFSQEKS